MRLRVYGLDFMPGQHKRASVRRFKASNEGSMTNMTYENLAANTSLTREKQYTYRLKTPT